jgi:hypothetical protein
VSCQDLIILPNITTQHATLPTAPANMASPDAIKTKFLVLSDTHDNAMSFTDLPQSSVDVVIHCGDFTNGSNSLNST